MKRVFGVILCSIMLFSACVSQRKIPVYKTLEQADAAHLEQCPEERLEDVMEVAENTHLAIYTRQLTMNRDVALNKVAFVHYVLYQETEEGFVPADDTELEVDTFAGYTVHMKTPWLGEGKIIEVCIRGFTEELTPEEQQEYGGFQKIYKQEHGWLGLQSITVMEDI